MIKVGQKVKIYPFAFVTGSGAEMERDRVCVGTVVYVNEQHKWFSVEYGDPKMRASYKFCDIGSVVMIRG